jgi:hypothetical protein
MATIFEICFRPCCGDALWALVFSFVGKGVKGLGSFGTKKCLSHRIRSTLVFPHRTHGAPAHEKCRNWVRVVDGVLQLSRVCFPGGGGEGVLKFFAVNTVQSIYMYPWTGPQNGRKLCIKKEKQLNGKGCVTARQYLIGKPVMGSCFQLPRQPELQSAISNTMQGISSPRRFSSI